LKNTTNRILLTLIMFVLVVFGDGLKLRSYCLYAICGVLIIYCLTNILMDGRKLFVNPELWIIVAFLLYSSFSYFWAIDKSLVLYRMKVVFFMTILVILVANMFVRDGDYSIVINLYWMMGLLLSVICIFHFGISGLKNMIVSGVRLGRNEGAFLGINANTIGMDCATAGIISIYYCLFENKKKRLWALVPIVFVVVATGSRKGLFVLLFGVVAISFFYQIKNGKRTLSTFLKVLLIFTSLLILLNFIISLPGMEKARDQYMGFISSLIGEEEKADLSTKARVNMVAVGWENFLKAPLFGYGLDNGKVINRIYNDFSAYLHNNYIEILVNGGIVGFVIYYLFYLVVFIKHIKRLNERNPLVYISLILLALRFFLDLGKVSYYDYLNIVLYPFWIAVANGFDLGKTHEGIRKREWRYVRY